MVTTEDSAAASGSGVVLTAIAHYYTDTASVSN